MTMDKELIVQRVVVAGVSLALALTLAYAVAAAFLHGTIV
jgi:hypothetical protein